MKTIGRGQLTKACHLLFVLSLLASPALAQGKAVKLHVSFLATDDTGFVTAESKDRQAVLTQVLKRLSKAKGLVVVVDSGAAVTVNIVSHENKGTGASETKTSALGVALQTPALKETTEIREVTIRAVLTFGDYNTDLVGVGRYDSIAEDKLVTLINAWVKDNAEKIAGASKDVR